MCGYVTTLISVVRKPPRALSTACGFAPDRLDDGFALYFLAESVGRDEFLWRGYTRHSAGWVADAEAVFNGVQYMTQWADQARYRSVVVHGGDTTVANARFDSLLEREHKKLQVRAGSDRIVKVVPIRNRQNEAYPDAPDDTNVPQWELMVPKFFVCAAVEAPGRAYLGGGAGAAFLRVA